MKTIDPDELRGQLLDALGRHLAEEDPAQTAQSLVEGIHRGGDIPSARRSAALNIIQLWYEPASDEWDIDNVPVETVDVMADAMTAHAGTAYDAAVQRALR